MTTLYVMTDDRYGQDYFITTWEQFEAECAQLGWDASEANLTTLDDYLAPGISIVQANNLEQSAREYGAWEKVQSALKITPHKGGRTARVDLLATPETKATFATMAKNSNQSQSDLFEKMVDLVWDLRYNPDGVRESINKIRDHNE